MKPWKIQLMKVKKKKRFKLKMPGAFMILFILTVVELIATWVIPAGAYSKLSYEPSSQELKIVNPHNQVKRFRVRNRN
ncbi:hypothetical protein ACVNP0_15125 [Staphylococcus aureus]